MKIRKLLCILAVMLCFIVALTSCDMIGGGGSGGGGKSSCKGSHTEGELVKEIPATCTEPLTKIFVCSKCDKQYNKKFGEPLGHTITHCNTYNNDHTCTEDGTGEGVCDVCYQTVTGKIPGTAKHEFDLDIICKNCNEAEYVTKNLEFTLNDDGTGYIVSWKVMTYAEVQAAITNGDNRTERETIINIPATYNNLPVVEIVENGFNNDNVQKSADWPETYEASELFVKYNYLSSVKLVYIPASVKKVGSNAFYNVGGTKSAQYEGFKLVLSEGLEEIAPHAFAYANIKGKVVLPMSLTALGEGAFCGCPIDEVELHCVNITTMPEDLFLFSNIRKLTVPSFVTEINSGAFESYKLLTLVVKSSDLTVYPGAFGNKVNTVIDESGAEYILSQVEEWFSYPNENLHILDEDPNKMITIDAQIDVPDNQAHVYVDGKINLYYSHINGENILTEYVVVGGGEFKELIIPEGITMIADGVFYIRNTVRIVFPDSLKSINLGEWDLFEPTTLEVSEYTDLSNVNIAAIENLIIRENHDTAVKLDYNEIIEALKAENNYAITVGGVKFDFSSRTDDAFSNVHEDDTFTPSCAWVDCDDMNVIISFVDENDERVATKLSIRARDSFALSNKKFELNGYYYDKETESLVHLDNDHRDISFNDLTPATRYYLLASDQFSWTLTLDSDDGEAIEIQYIELRFDAPKYDADLNKIQ